jgi:hypothetical protein
MHAVLLGLRAVVEHFVPNLVDQKLAGVFLRLDCKRVVDDLNKRLKAPQPTEGQTPYLLSRAEVVNYCAEHRIWLNVKHVPGHAKEKNPKRRWMNAQVDALGNMRGKKPLSES